VAAVVVPFKKALIRSGRVLGMNPISMDAKSRQGLCNCAAFASLYVLDVEPTQLLNSRPLCSRIL
jgi:hypothetical protein